MKDKKFTFKTTKEISTPKKIIDQVIGQEDANRIITKASKQRRHVLLIGEPGTGKSMLGLALAELLPKEKLMDILSFFNPNDENAPLIKTTAGGKGRELINKSNLQKGGGMFSGQSFIYLILALAIGLMPYFWWKNGTINDIIYAAFIVSGTLLIFGILIAISIGSKAALGGNKKSGPKVIVDNYNKKNAPFFDATGAHAGSLLGDVLHDPFQTGGLGTPAHKRVVAGMIHKAHMGVLFIDEIGTLQPGTQQELLTALQEGKYSITGQSERSAGAMVKTEQVPCKFVLVAAGNEETVAKMHPALRSRIRGYGYEVYMKDTMKDTFENRLRIARFVSQEVRKDGKIPHFNRAAVELIIEVAKKNANRKGHLTLRLRELGGIIRAAGDIAVEQNNKIVTSNNVIEALKVARTLEQQMADKYIERKKEYEVIKTFGEEVGRVNGLAVIGSGNNHSGILLPIEAAVAVSKESKFTATGKLGEIAKEAVINVSAIIQKYFGEDIKEKHEVFIQFLQTYEGVEGDSASIAIATTIISALKNVPIKQNYAMTGSLSVRGEVLPIGGITAKVEAAIEAGIDKVIVPHSNLQDIVINKEELKKIKIIPVHRIEEVLKEVINWKGHTKELNRILKK